MFITPNSYQTLTTLIRDRFDTINPSPYSASFYNTDDVDWGYKPEGSLRVSDHWNFHAGDTWHAQTIDGEAKNILAVGEYHNGYYTLIFQADPLEIPLEDDNQYRVLFLNHGDLRDAVIKGSTINVIEQNPYNHIVAVTYNEEESPC